VTVSVVLVTGGTGTLGKQLVPLLTAQGHQVRVLSRRDGAGTHTGDLTTGVGVAEAAAGAELVVHAASNTRRFGRGDVTQTRNLLQAIPEAAHLLYVSIVGIESIPLPYYKQKLACEEAIASHRAGDDGRYTIFRATQFHDLLALLLQAAERLPVAPLPVDFRFQPVAAAEVAERIAALLNQQPRGRADDFGGPEVLTLGDMARTWQSQRGRPRRVVRFPFPGRIGAGFRQGRNTCPGHRDGVQTWAEFLQARPR
jgi:uncharacterized protein YbjT (DUF2867 family)